MKGANKADVMYAREMISHHQMAVKMSDKLIEDGQNEELYYFAKKVVETQTKEIAELRAWLKDHHEKEM